MVTLGPISFECTILLNIVFQSEDVAFTHSNGFLACSYGFYGLNCTLTCNDKCTGCNNVNGDCNNGCTPGWEGGSCQQRNAYK